MKDRHEFKPIAVEIDEAPVSPLGRTTFWIVLALAAFVVGWLTLARVDVVVTARGKVVPRGQVKVIQPLDTGVVKALHVVPGDTVKQGQLLVEIEPETTEPAMASSDQNLAFVQLEMQRLQAMLAGTPFAPAPGAYPAEWVAMQQTVYASGMQALQQQLAAKQQELARVQQQQSGVTAALQQATHLLQITQAKQEKMAPVADLLPQKDILATQEDTVRYDGQRDMALAQQRELHHRASQIASEMSHLRETFRTQLLAELATKQQQAIDWTARSKELHYRNARQRIVAPMAGTINQRLVNTVGGVVTPAEPLLTLVPEGTALEVEALAENRDVGSIQPGMPVALKVDTFDFQKYGTLDAVVRHVSSDAIEDEQRGQVFVVAIQPLETTVRLDDGKRQGIRPGMLVTAEIKVGRRRMIEFFLYPVLKALDESFSLR